MRRFFTKTWPVWLFLLAGFLPSGRAKSGARASLVINARSRVEVDSAGSQFRIVCRRMQWDPAHTAVIICDMWDRHWCKGAERRVRELAPRINRFVSAAREQGVLIVHAPSDVVDAYRGHPARLRARRAAPAANVPEGIDRWCRAVPSEEGRKWPIDQSDGGCDCDPPCKEASPWRKQIEAIEIRDEDAISDSGAEIWNLFQERGIRNVILVGVHTNMCVLGRPFGLRNLARFGMNVVLCRDLTDTMYNHRMWPYVNHFAGTDLIIEYIEKFICPTILSTDLTGEPPFRFKEDARPRVVFVSAESEYGADQSLAWLAHELIATYGLNCEFLQGSTQRRGPERNFIPNLEVLDDADLLVLFVRRRALPPRQMRRLRAYFDAGKPLVAFRTSSHAFALRKEAPAGLEQWPDFDREVLGCHYQGYPHGETEVRVVPAAADHPILSGLNGPYRVRETLYRSLPLAESCRVLLMGRCVDGGGNDPRYRKDPNEQVQDQPVAWTNSYRGARIFYTSLGSVQGAFKQEWFRRMIIQAVHWALGGSLLRMDRR